VNGDILPILRDWGTRDLKSRTVETLLRDAADEIERLRRWKVEATAVLEGWDAVWECAGRGTLGESKQRGVIARLGELDDEIERLRALGDALAGYSGQPCKCLRDPDDRLDDVCNPCKHRFAWLEARRG